MIYKTAVQVGEKAEARIYIGRRVWYNVAKIEAYLKNISI